jgi:hypothetical protein
MEYIQFAVQSLSTLNPKILRVLRVFRAVRAVRALRVLRTISFLKNLQVGVRPASCQLCFKPLPLRVAWLTGNQQLCSTTLSRQVIVSTLLNSIPAMGSIILLLFLVSCEILYIQSSVISRLFRLGLATTAHIVTWRARSHKFVRGILACNRRCVCNHGCTHVLRNATIQVWVHVHGEFHTVSTDYTGRLV